MSRTNRKPTGLLAFLVDAELHTSFLRIRQNLELYCIASVIREFLLLGMRENEPGRLDFPAQLMGFA